MIALLNYFKGSWRELGRISWPSRKQTTKLTVAVVVFSIIFGIFIGSVDFGLSELVKRVLIKE